MVDSLNYTRMFSAVGNTPAIAYDRGGPGMAVADRAASSEVYVFDEATELAVNVALATARPLLVRGPSGCGKSSLARAVAARLKWRYYEAIITSRTQARDLLYTYDALARLNDATAHRDVSDTSRYVRPGPLWRAFDAKVDPPPDGSSAAADSVVLIDEIDKADPDVPNGLLVPLGALWFEVEESRQPVKADPAHPPLVIITSNDERELPPAFRRRCVTLTLDAPSSKRLVEIAQLHYGNKHNETALYMAIAKVVRPDDGKPASGRAQQVVSTAEYLDAVHAALQTNTKPGDAAWQAISNATLNKA